MEVTIKINGQDVSVEVSVEVYEYLDRADHKNENLAHEQRRHWDGRAFDEYIVATESAGVYGETPEQYTCRRETLDELLVVCWRAAPKPSAVGFCSTRWTVTAMNRLPIWTVAPRYLYMRALRQSEKISKIFQRPP